MVAVYNFQPTPQNAQVYLGVVDTPCMVDVLTGAALPEPEQFPLIPIDLPAYGYRFFTVIPPTGVVQFSASP
jgi:hypothetical protein